MLFWFRFCRFSRCLCTSVAVALGASSAVGQTAQKLPPEAQLLVDRGTAAEKKSDWRELIAIGDEAVLKYPKGWIGWLYKGQGYFQLSDWPEAAAAFNVVTSLNPQHWLAWNNLGACYSNLGNDEKALDAFEKALKLNPRADIILFNILGAYNALGLHDKVRETYSALKDVSPERAAQAIQRYGQPVAFAVDDAPAPEAPFKANMKAVREGLAKIEFAEKLVEQERIAEALPLLETAFKVLSENLGSGSDEALQARDLLAFAYADEYRIWDALSLTGPRNYMSGISRYRRIYEKRVSVHGLRSEQAIRAATAISYALERSGELGEAQQLITKTFSIAVEELGEAHRATLTAGLVKQNMYGLLGQHDEAVAIGERIVSVAQNKYGESDPITIAALWNLGPMYVAMKKPQTGIPILEKALELTRQRGGETNRQALTMMSALGVAYGLVGRHTDALLIAERAIRNTELAFGPNSPETAQLLVSVGTSYLLANQLDQATRAAQRAIRIQDKIRNSDNSSPSTAKMILALAYMAQRRITEATDLLAELIPRVEKMRASGDFSPDERQSLFAKFATPYRLHAMLLAGRNPNESFRISELSKARTLLESTAMQRAASSGVLNASDAKTIQYFERRIGELNDRLANVSQNLVLKASLEAEKAKEIREFSDFRAAVAKRNPRYARLSDVKVVGPNEAKEIIPADAVFVSYLEVNGNLLIFALESSGALTTKFVPLIPKLQENIEKYRLALSNPSALDVIVSRNLAVSGTTSHPPEPTSLQDLSEYFGRILLDPIAKQIRGKRMVIVSPDGILSLMPFETLLFDGKPFVLNYDVSYTQSLSMLSLLKERKTEYSVIANRQELFAMGGATYTIVEAGTEKVAERKRPDFLTNLWDSLSHLIGKAVGSINASESKAEQASIIMKASRGDRAAVQRAFDKLEAKWENLPGSEKEVNAVSDIFGKQRSLVLTQLDASEQMLQELNRSKELSRYKRLLFSTHGYLSTYEPALSSIVLGQTNKTPEADGYVTASEWTSYDLKSDLVVLSACETGLGKVVKGEGVLGLPFALYVAGNTSTVITLWSILDDSTSDFVERFFKKIDSGMPESAALSQTKREFIRTKKYEQPVFWAPFVLYGY
jgi:CHAT domain-containing protein